MDSKRYTGTFDADDPESWRRAIGSLVDLGVSNLALCCGIPKYMARVWWMDGVLAGDMLNEYKREQGCQNCLEHDPSCLDFHHRDPESKSFSLSSVRNRHMSPGDLLHEIVKCDVLCRNCHALTHRDMPSMRTRESVLDLPQAAFIQHGYRSSRRFKTSVKGLLDYTFLIRVWELYPEADSPRLALHCAYEDEINLDTMMLKAAEDVKAALTLRVLEDSTLTWGIEERP